MIAPLARGWESWNLDSRQLADVQTSPWSIKKETLHGGKQEGVDLLTIDTGGFVVRVIPTRGMSILDVRTDDLVLGWQSPVHEVVHPQYVRLDSRRGLGWLEGFNEWMVRCGLEYAGHPGTDSFVTNTGDTAEMDLTLHGKIGNIPASRVEVIVDRTPPYRIRVRGNVSERSFFGPKLDMTTELSFVPGESSFRLSDTVTNGGGQPQEMQLIYHANFGAPLLQRGARVIAAINRIEPMNDNAARQIDNYAVYEAPTPGFSEQVYLVTPFSDADGYSRVMLSNADGDRAASISWSVRQLPYLTIWKNTAAVEDGYVTGLEPATGFPFNRKVEREAGRVPRLSPGETRTFELEFGLHVGKEAVREVARSIAVIQGDRAPEIRSAPPTP